MIEVREAADLDVEGIIELFHAAYGENYTYPSYYDPHVLKKMVYEDDTLILVASDTKTKQVLGTASVIFDTGAFGDLAGEFGRLVVHPDGRRKGIGNRLMEARLKHAADRLHVGFVENRVAHIFSQRISDRNGFAAAGFLPLKSVFDKRESLAVYVRHFDGALKLRRNNPHIIPEGFLLAQHVLSNCGIEADAIPDDDAPAYPDERGFDFEKMTAPGYATLLRFERAQAHQKEIFGPARILQGLFRLKATQSHYILARESGQMVGAVGFTIDDIEKAVRIFEVVTLETTPIRCLIEEVISIGRRDYDIKYIEADVSAYSPRMQRTLLELQFLPVAYLPALSFQGAERCDAIRMARLFLPADFDGVRLHETTRAVFEIVKRNFTTRDLIPRLAEALPHVRLFSKLRDNQVRRMAEICTLRTFPEGTRIVDAGDNSKRAYVLLEGEFSVYAGSEKNARKVGTILKGECFGETALLNREPHSVSAVATKVSEVAVIERSDLDDLMRKRPDIGVRIYKNLAKSLGRKLRGLNADIAKYKTG